MFTERIFTLVATAIAIATGAALGALLLVASNAVEKARRLKLAGIAVAVLAGTWFLGSAFLGLTNPSLFAVIHWWYLLGVVTLPVAGIVVLLGTLGRFAPGGRTGRQPRAARRLALVGGALLVLPAAVGFYATHLEPNRLLETNVAVPLSPQRSGSATLRIAVLSDLQTLRIGDHERQAIELVVEANPDLILVPGDVLQAPDRIEAEMVPLARELFARLADTAPTVVVPGNVDGAELPLLLDGTGAVLLENQIRTLDIEDHTVNIAGLALDARSPAAVQTIDELTDLPGASDIRIVLSHVPDSILELPNDSRVDLVASGHTHGGQIVLPWFGPPMTLTNVPRDVAAGGLSTLAGNRIVVSRGVGLERGYAPQMRLGAPPEIVVIELG